MRNIIKISLCSLCLFAVISCNQMGGFKKLAGGVEYKILKDGSTKTNIKVGDVVSVYIINSTDKDSIIMDSHKSQNGMPPKPFTIPIKASQGKFDIMGWLIKLRKGDSAVFMIPTDSIFPDEKMRPPFIKAHSKVKSVITVVDVMSEAQAQQKQMDEMKKVAADQDGMIQSYIAEKGLKDVKKTASGLYYIITKAGSGANAEAGKMVKMNYTGQLLNGKKFDSNVDTTFHHVKPFEFTLGQHQVSPGWDEGVELLNKGAKATFIVPSALGYGPQANQAIPANSVLVFDVELVSFK